MGTAQHRRRREKEAAAAPLRDPGARVRLPEPGRLVYTWLREA